MEQDFTGMVCVCSVGRVGIVSGQKGDAWVGIGIDGNGLWMSSSPHILAHTLDEYVKRLEDRPNCYMHKWPLDCCKA